MDLLSTPVRRNILFALLYFCEGAPIGFIWWALPTQLRVAGMPVDKITAITSILVIPWAFKFLWAPLVDTFQTRRWTLRSWIMTAQGIMGIALLPLLFFDLKTETVLLLPLLLVHTLSAATQDVSIDALCIGAISDTEFGSINGWMQVGMLLGRSLFGGMTLVVAQAIGESAMLIILIAILWTVALLMFFLKIPDVHYDLSQKISDVGTTLKKIVKRPSTWYGLLFAIIGGTAYEGVGAVAGPFFIDRGFSSTEVGFFFSVPSVISMMVGAVAGGWLSDKLGKYRSVVYALLSVVTVVLSISLADSFGMRSLLFPFLSILYLTIGIFTSSSYAMFMEITDPKVGATQFSTFMGGTNMCESWSTYAVGLLVAHFDYAAAFAIIAAVSLASVFLIGKIARKEMTPA